MARKQEKRFLEEAKKIMEDNIHLARFNESLKNIEKLKIKFFEISEENDRLVKDNEQLRGLLTSLNENNHALLDQINFLEEIINGLHVIVSIKDLNKKNLLWYNKNYDRLLGYKHKELQELQDEETMNLYHPEDRPKIEERSKLTTNSKSNRFSCVVRLRHVNGNWIKMNSDYIALRLNPDGSWSQAIEILSNIEAQPECS